MIWLIIFLPLIISTAIFIISLIRYCKAKDSPELREKRKSPFIASTVLLGVVLLAYIGMAVLLSYGIRNM